MDNETNSLTAQSKPKKFEFSKIIVSVLLVSVVAMIAECLILSWYTLDPTWIDEAKDILKPVTIAAIGFYLWKAKHENLIKLKVLYGSTADFVIGALGKASNYRKIDEEEDTKDLSTELRL